MPGNVNEPISLGASATAAHQALAEAAQRKGVAEKQARLTYDAETAAHHRLLRELVERFEERAIALSEDEAPVSRSRMPLRPTEISATVEGIELYWEADWPSYPHSHTVTWAELMNEETEHAPV